MTSQSIWNAIDKNGNVNIFQIRPLTTIKNWKKISSIELKETLKKNQKLFLKINKKNKRYGNFPIFGLCQIGTQQK